MRDGFGPFSLVSVAIRDPLADPARLAAVGRVLPVAVAARAALDRLAELAAVVMDAPVGLVNLIEAEEQHLVGAFGIGEPLATRRRLPLDVSFCKSTLLLGKPVYVADADEDPEFADHPGHVDLGFVGYAGAPLRDTDGQLIGTVCVTDVRPRRWRRVDQRALEALTESVASELTLHRDIDRRQRLLDAFELAPAAIAVTRGPQHVVDYRNPAYRSIFGDLAVGMPGRAALPDLPESFFALMDRVRTTGETYRADEAGVELVWPGESAPRTRYFDFSYSRIGADTDGSDGVLTVAVEVTDRVAALHELARYARRQEMLARASAALNRNLDPESELRELARVTVPELADVATVHRLVRPVPPGLEPTFTIVTDRMASVAVPGLELPAVAEGLRWHGPNPLVDAIRQGTLIAPSATPEPPTWALRTGAAGTIRGGMHHVATAPVIVDGMVVAVAFFGVAGDRPAWTGDELAALAEITRYAGIALGHGLSYQRTRDSALVLQHSLLTDPPEVPGLELCARYRPAGHDEVGGDWYDAFRLDGDDVVALAIGDVVGHDIGAAAAMAQLRATLRSLALDRGEGPAATLDRLATLNERLAVTGFATLLHAHLVRAGGWTLRWSNAGHPPPVLVTRDGATRLLDGAAGLALVPGFARPRTEARVALPPGSTLLLYTDGLVERRHTHLGENLDALRGRAGGAALRHVEDLCDEVLRHTAAEDDVAVLAIRVLDG